MCCPAPIEDDFRRAVRRELARLVPALTPSTGAYAEIWIDGELTTSVAPDEIVTEVRVPLMEGYGYGYEKFNRRQEDWAMVAVCALVRKGSDGSAEDVRIGAPRSR